MVTLQCSLCGRPLELSESLEPGQPVTCDHCGQITAVRLASPRPVASRPPASIAPPVLDGETPAEEEAGATDATKVREPGAPPSKPPPAPTYEFLDPPQAPGELGRLAHYRVLKVLGRGGMGIVFQAEDLHLQRPVALKVMSPALAQVAAYRQRFLREARAMASVRNDRIVTIHEVGQDKDLPYLAMELLEEERLDVWLQHVPKPSLDHVLRIGLQIAQGLQAAHERGLIHRDIKPANIWLQGGEDRVKILDFGLARITNDEVHLTQMGTIMGTPAYMAPEQAESEAVDHRCDLFSLGCVLYHLATGQLPFSGKTTMSILKAVALKEPPRPRDLDPTLPPALADLIVQLLAKHPADRPASAHAVVEQLQVLLPGLTPVPFSIGSASGGSSAVFAPPLDPSGASLPVPPPRRRGLGLVAALALVVGLAVVAGVVWLKRPAGGPPPEQEEIAFGISAAFEGPSRELGRNVEVGIRTYFQHVNEEGGVRGRKLKLVPLDDRYEPDLALANMRKFHEEHRVIGVIGNVGTPTAEVTMPYAIEKKMLFFGAFTGAQLLRSEPPARYVFNYRASYEQETAVIVDYLRKKRRLRPEQIAVFAQDDAYGEAGFRGVAKRLRDVRDETEIVRVAHKRNSSDVRQAVETILRHPEVRAVVMVSVYRPAAEFIFHLKNQRPDLIFANVSFVDSEALAEELKDKDRSGKYVEGVLITQVVPLPNSPATAIAEYRQRLKAYYPQASPNFVSLEGYIAARILVEGLRRTEGEITTEAVVDKLETIAHLELGIGTPLGFGPDRHQASNKVWGTVLDKAGQYQLLELE